MTIRHLYPQPKADRSSASAAIGSPADLALTLDGGRQRFRNQALPAPICCNLAGTSPTSMPIAGPEAFSYWWVARRSASQQGD